MLQKYVCLLNQWLSCKNFQPTFSDLNKDFETTRGMLKEEISCRNKLLKCSVLRKHCILTYVMLSSLMAAVKGPCSWYSLLVPKKKYKLCSWSTADVDIDSSGGSISNQSGDLFLFCYLRALGGWDSICRNHLKINILAVAAWDKQWTNWKSEKGQAVQGDTWTTEVLECSSMYFWNLDSPGLSECLEETLEDPELSLMADS